MRACCRYCIRISAAWLFAWFVVLLACFVSVIYALKFGDDQIRKAIIGWLVAYGWTFLIVGAPGSHHTRQRPDPQTTALRAASAHTLTAPCMIVPVR